jgi:predicted enzyme related to lactoylglutathione lyase
VISCKGELVGGLVEVEPVAGQEVSQWIAYTSVADVDAAVAAVEKAGGNMLVPPAEVSSTGTGAAVN